MEFGRADRTRSIEAWEGILQSASVPPLQQASALPKAGLADSLQPWSVTVIPCTVDHGSMPSSAGQRDPVAGLQPYVGDRALPATGPQLRAGCRGAGTGSSCRSIGLPPFQIRCPVGAPANRGGPGPSSGRWADPRPPANTRSCLHGSRLCCSERPPASIICGSKNSGPHN